MSARYEIRIKGLLDADWSDWFENLTITHLGSNQTLIVTLVPDQSALHGLLEKIRDLNLVLISVEYIDMGTAKNRSKPRI